MVHDSNCHGGRLKINRKALAAARAAAGRGTGPDPLAGLFPAQLAFVTDPSRFKTALTTRQAGKSHACIRLLLHTAMTHPGSVCLYLGLSQVAAERLFWRRLCDEAEHLGLTYRPNQVKCTLTLPNRSVIHVSGAETESDIKAFRGLVCQLIILDEAQDFPEFMPKLVQEVLEPCLNTTQGSLVLTGTPSARCAGYFFDATNGSSAWSNHFWLGSANPAAHQSEDDLAQIRARHGWQIDSPAFRREFQGEWVASDEELVYAYTLAKNGWDGTFPPGFTPTYVLGLDIGYRDRTTFVLAAYWSGSPVLYFPRVEGYRGLTMDAIADIIGRLKREYKINTIVADAGGLGKMIVESIRQRYKLNIIPAVKTEKMAAQRMLNTDFRTGRIRAVHGTPLN